MVDTVKPYGMTAFSHVRLAGDADRLRVHFTGALIGAGEPLDDRWGVNVLLRPTAASHFDSVVSMQVNADGTDTIAIDAWRDFAEALVVVTNGHEQGDGDAWVSFDTVAVRGLSPTLAVFPNPLRLSDPEARKKGIVFRRIGLRSVQVYTVDGILVWQQVGAQDSTAWHAENRRNRTVAPGTYFALVEYADSRSTELAVAKRKLLVLP
jgi:hypothetical protein